MHQSAVTGEHTCMILKPLNNDEIEANGTDQWGFLGPFFQGERGVGGNNVLYMVFLRFEKANSLFNTTF